LNTLYFCENPLKGMQALTDAYKHLNLYKNKYGARLNAKNLMCVKQLIAVIMALGKNLKRFKGENGAKIETTRELIVGAKIDQIDLFKLAGYMAQSQISNKVKGFQRKEKSKTGEVKINSEKSNALKDFLKKPAKGAKTVTEESPAAASDPAALKDEDFGLSPLLQVEIFLGVLLTPGADIRIITTKDPAAYQLVLLNPASVFAELCSDVRSGPFLNRFSLATFGRIPIGL